MILFSSITNQCKGFSITTIPQPRTPSRSFSNYHFSSKNTLNLKIIRHLLSGIPLFVDKSTISNKSQFMRNFSKWTCMKNASKKTSRHFQQNVVLKNSTNKNQNLQIVIKLLINHRITIYLSLLSMKAPSPKKKKQKN